MKAQDQIQAWYIQGKESGRRRISKRKNGMGVRTEKERSRSLVASQTVMRIKYYWVVQFGKLYRGN